MKTPFRLAVVACSAIFLAGVVVPILGYWRFAGKSDSFLQAGIALWKEHPGSALLLFLPFFLHLLFICFLCARQAYSLRGVGFLTFAGLLGSFMVQWPGIKAAWAVTAEPSLSMWMFIAFLASCTMGLAVAAARLTIIYFWLDS